MKHINYSPLGELRVERGEWIDQARVDLYTPLGVKGSHLVLILSKGGSLELSVGKVVFRSKFEVVLEGLNFPDKAKVLKILPYSRAFSVFKVKGSESLNETEKKKYFFYLATNFHGKTCVGVALGVRMALKASEILEVDLSSKELKVECRSKACIADALQGICAANNKRFFRRKIKDKSSKAIFKTNTQKLMLELTSQKITKLEDAISLSDEMLFSLIEEKKVV